MKLLLQKTLQKSLQLFQLRHCFKPSLNWNSCSDFWSVFIKKESFKSFKTKDSFFIKSLQLLLQLFQLRDCFTKPLFMKNSLISTKLRNLNRVDSVSSQASQPSLKLTRNRKITLMWGAATQYSWLGWSWPVRYSFLVRMLTVSSQARTLNSVDSVLLVVTHKSLKLTRNRKITLMWGAVTQHNLGEADRYFFLVLMLTVSSQASTFNSVDSVSLVVTHKSLKLTLTGKRTLMWWSVAQLNLIEADRHFLFSEHAHCIKSIGTFNSVDYLQKFAKSHLIKLARAGKRT